MQFTTVALALASAALVQAQATLMVNTPTSVVQCQPVALSWTGGSAPYYISIIPGGQAGAAAIESFPTQSGTSYTWNVDLPAGESITVQIKDNTGAINYSDKVTIQAGTSTSCVNSAAAGGAAAASTDAAAASSAPAAAGTAASSTAAAAATTAASAAGGAASAARSGGASVASAAAAGASSAASAAGSAAAAATPTSGAEKISAGLFTVVAGALFAIFA